MKKIRCALTILFILMTFVGSSISALAAHAEEKDVKIDDRRTQTSIGPST